MFNINDPANNTPRVVKLSGSSIGNATTQIKVLRVLGAVNINSSGALVFTFSNSDIDERAFYENFFFSVSMYDENAAKAQAQYFVTTLANNPNAFTVEELAFLAKTMIYPNWTNPVLMTWEQWENLARTNTVAFATLFSQLVPNGSAPTGTGTEPTNTPNLPTDTTPGNTGTGTNGTGVQVKQDNGFVVFLKQIPLTGWLSIASTLLILYFTRNRAK